MAFWDKFEIEKAIKSPTYPVRNGVLSEDGKTIFWSDGSIEIVKDSTKEMKLTLNN
ncbi:hypothetical protein V7166_22915 [Bacillus thuringiensis]